jgi:hypothetical protein
MENISIRGVITLYKIPDWWSDEMFKYWWCPETDSLGHILRPARMSDEVKAQHIAKPPVENLITNNGLTSLLSNMCISGIGSLYPFFQILSVGNGAITGVARADTAVAGDGFTTGARKAPTSYTVTGFSAQVVTNFASGDAVGTWTNVGIYGYNSGSAQNATTTSGTGNLNTHALYNFTKGSSAYALNYAFTLSN